MKVKALVMSVSGKLKPDIVELNLEGLLNLATQWGEHGMIIVSTNDTLVDEPELQELAKKHQVEWVLVKWDSWVD